jgi:hypothetical protein
VGRMVFSVSTQAQMAIAAAEIEVFIVAVLFVALNFAAGPHEHSEGERQHGEWIEDHDFASRFGAGRLNAFPSAYSRRAASAMRSISA